jgi:hypothetical protein
VEVKLKGREIPRNSAGDAKFEYLDNAHLTGGEHPADATHVLGVFTPEEVVELVNRALYQIEYQREAHRKRGKEERDRLKALREALKAQGLDPRKVKVERELKGE